MYADSDGNMPKWPEWLIGGAFVVAAVALTIWTAGAGTAAFLAASMGDGFWATVGCGALVGVVSGAFGGTALGHGGMFLSGFVTRFAGSIAKDLVKTGSIDDVRLGAAIWSGLLGGALSGITTGAQNKQFASLSKFNNRIKVCKSKGLTNSYFTKAIKRSSALVRSANMAVIKSIPQTIGSTIIDFYW